MDAVLDALADPTRRGLLERLRVGGPLSIGALSSGQPMSRQAVTKHLDALHHAGLVRVHWRGRERLHEVEPMPLRQLDEWLAPYAAAWDDRLSRLQQHLEEKP